VDQNKLHRVSNFETKYIKTLFSIYIRFLVLMRQCLRDYPWNRQRKISEISYNTGTYRLMFCYATQKEKEIIEMQESTLL
jgi:hypothetical protein